MQIFLPTDINFEFYTYSVGQKFEFLTKVSWY